MKPQCKELTMRKILQWTLALALVLTLGIATAQAGGASNAVDDLTGAVWMQSSPDNKLALVYGVECAITVEFFVAQKLAEERAAKGSRKKNTQELIDTLSPFEKGWAKAFEGVSREDIVQKVDAWYNAHPDQLARPVFAVLWYEMIAPKL